MHRTPEQRERPGATGVIPDAGADRTVGPGNPTHLGQSGHRVGHEVHHQLGERHVEGGVGERQSLGTSLPHVHLGEPLAGRRHEARRRVDRRDLGRADAADEFSGERTRPAAHIEDPLLLAYRGEFGELVRQRFGEAAHEAGVRLRRDVETHPTTIGRRVSFRIGEDGAMANLIYTAITSLDGYVVDADGNFDWAAPDEEVHAFVNDLERGIGTYLYGRRLYEVMVYWETAHLLDDQPAVELDYARVWQAATKIIYSSTLESVSSARTTIERTFDPGRRPATEGELRTAISAWVDRASLRPRSRRDWSTSGISSSIRSSSAVAHRSCPTMSG